MLEGREWIGGEDDTSASAVIPSKEIVEGFLMASNCCSEVPFTGVESLRFHDSMMEPRDGFACLVRDT